jgi:iron complex transport system permease protein
LLRNPLAEPYLLGVSSGAALGAAVAFLVFAPLAAFGPDAVALAGQYGLPAFAFAGSLLAVACVYILARAGSRTPVVSLILAGVAVSALLGAAQTLLVLRDPTLLIHLGSLYSWLSGGLLASGWGQLGIVTVLVVGGIAVALMLAPLLDAFALGEEGAMHLGVRVERAKLGIVAVAALLVACAVSLSGLVGFVGLFIPHVCRLIVGPRHRLLLPVSALVGSVFLIWADVLARTLVKPAELPLGVITALIGGPFFLWLLRQSGRDYRY